MHTPRRNRYFRARLQAAAVSALALATPAFACEPLGWTQFLLSGEQEFGLVERFPLDEERFVIAVEYGELVGEYAKVFLFLEATEECDLSALSLGSYELTNMLSDNGRVYHLDLYEPNLHTTINFYSTIPEYAELKAIALEIFQ